jgi:hypothetical protein
MMYAPTSSAPDNNVCRYKYITIHEKIFLSKELYQKNSANSCSFSQFSGSTREEGPQSLTQSVYLFHHALELKTMCLYILIQV